VQEEAEAEVMESERLQVRAEPAAGAQPPADLADDPLASLVVADEGDVAVALLSGLGLAEIVEQGAEAKRAAAGDLVGERLGEERGGAIGLLTGEARQIGLELERVLEHCQRVAVDVEVVIRVLDDAAQRRQLRQHRLGHGQLVHQRQAPERVGAADDPAQLRELALAGRLGGAGGGGPGQADGAGIGLEAMGGP
jgi:hypothetical protein